MISPRPAQTVAQLVDRHKSSRRASEGNEAVDPIQKNSRIHRGTTVLLSLADVAPVKIVDEPGREEGGESNGDALAVIQKVRSSGLPRNLLRSRFLEVLHLSARKQGFRATRGDVVIEPGNV